MINHQPTAAITLRMALAATFLSAVCARLNLWGANSSGWEDFLEYTADVNSFLPVAWIPTLAIMVTLLEIIISISLFIGYKIKFFAWCASILTLLFALAMAYSFGIKSPLDYSVFVDSAAAFLLTTISNSKWSLDNFLQNRKTV